MRTLLKEDKGNMIIEATILLPFCLLMVMALYYVAIFMCQKANIQANLQNALIYYKNVESDTYVEASTNMAYQQSDGTTIAANGGSYGEPKYLFPYRFIWMGFEESEFAKFFHSMCGHMFFDDGSNVEVHASTTNYVVYKQIKATATQTIKPAISFAMIGLGDSMVITCTSSVVVSDSDDFIRNVDFVVDIVEKSRLGKAASTVVEKAQDLYNSFKKAFGIS